MVSWFYALIRWLLTLLGVGTLVFLVLHGIPGDPVEVLLGEQASGAERLALQVKLGLDQPLWVQFGQFWLGLFQGDLGYSLFTQKSVTQLLAQAWPYTAQLALLAWLLGLMLALPLGLWAAARAGGWPDRLGLGLALLGTALPGFWLGPVLIWVFAAQLHSVPVGGATEPGAWILPTCTLGLGLAALTLRLTRGLVLETLQEDYIRTARAQGVSELRILWRHALPNAALPLLTVAGGQLGALLGGAVITETVFNWPGLGSLLIEAIQRRDYPVVQGCVLLLSINYILINGLTDWLYYWADPRLRQTQRR